jgi:hypothetical protein
MVGGSSPVLVLIPIPFGSKKWDPISIPIRKPDWNQAQITKSTQVISQDGLNCQNNKLNVPSIHLMAKIHQNDKQNVHFMGLLQKRNT